MKTLSVFVALMAFSIDAAVAATMRCADGIVAHGERSAQVLEKCGEPGTRKVFPPALDEFGNIVQGAATVELWTYGPNNGMYQHLRFIDGRLVQIRSQR